MKEFTLHSLIALYSIPGIGSFKLRKLIDAFGSPQLVLESPIQKLIHIQGIDKPTAIKIKTGVNKDFVEKQFTTMH